MTQTHARLTDLLPVELTIESLFKETRGSYWDVTLNDSTVLRTIAGISVFGKKRKHSFEATHIGVTTRDVKQGRCKLIKIEDIASLTRVRADSSASDADAARARIAARRDHG